MTDDPYLWTGREEDRSRAVCTFCDTDFVGTNGPGGGRFRDATALAEAIDRHGHDPDEDPANAYYTAWLDALERIVAARA